MRVIAYSDPLPFFFFQYRRNKKADQGKAQKQTEKTDGGFDAVNEKPPSGRGGIFFIEIHVQASCENSYAGMQLTVAAGHGRFLRKARNGVEIAINVVAHKPASGAAPFNSRSASKPKSGLLRPEAKDASGECRAGRCT